MRDFTNSFGFVIFFLCVVLGMSMIFGEGPTTMFLWLVLLSMIVLNADKVKTLMGRFSRA